MGLAVEFRVGARWNIFVLVEGDPVFGAKDTQAGEAARTMYNQEFFKDIGFYGRLGASYTF